MRSDITLQKTRFVCLYLWLSLSSSRSLEPACAFKEQVVAPDRDEHADDAWPEEGLPHGGVDEGHRWARAPLPPPPSHAISPCRAVLEFPTISRRHCRHGPQSIARSASCIGYLGCLRNDRHESNEDLNEDRGEQPVTPEIQYNLDAGRLAADRVVSAALKRYGIPIHA